MKKLWKETAKKSTVKQAGKYLAATALLSCVAARLLPEAGIREAEDGCMLTMTEERDSPSGSRMTEDTIGSMMPV